MTNQDEQKNQSLKILQLISKAIKKNDPARPRLLEAIDQIKNNAAPWPVHKADWESFCQRLGLNFSRQQYKKILSNFPAWEQEIAEDARKHTLHKMRR